MTQKSLFISAAGSGSSYVHQGYMSGGAGYALSREALRRFVQGFSTGRCKHFISVEDMALGRCMETMGVKAGDSRDPNKRETFNPFRPENQLISPMNGKQAWGYSYFKTKQGPDCCAYFVISFLYVKPEDMLEYSAHHLRSFGYKYRFNTNHEQNRTSELKPQYKHNRSNKNHRDI